MRRRPRSARPRRDRPRRRRTASRIPARGRTSGPMTGRAPREKRGRTHLETASQPGRGARRTRRRPEGRSARPRRRRYADDPPHREAPRPSAQRAAAAGARQAPPARASVAGASGLRERPVPHGVRRSARHARRQQQYRLAGRRKGDVRGAAGTWCAGRLFWQQVPERLPGPRATTTLSTRRARGPRVERHSRPAPTRVGACELSWTDVPGDGRRGPCRSAPRRRRRRNRDPRR